MIKGFLALFRSGIIFDPFVLLGVIMGIFTAMTPNKEAVEALYKQDSFYLLILLLSFLYNYLVKKVYKDDGDHLDYLRMGWNIFMSLVKFVLACTFSIMFIMMVFSF